MTETTHPVYRGGLDDLPRVEPLWHALSAHHGRVLGDGWQLREEQDSWRRRRSAYVGWLESGDGRLLLARDVRQTDDDAPLAGYAFVRIRPGEATLEVGERVGELESLSVAPQLRGSGVGSALIDAARSLLREEGVEYWSVTYFETNVDAGRLYERAGFLPYNRMLMGRVER